MDSELLDKQQKRRPTSDAFLWGNPQGSYTLEAVGKVVGWLENLYGH
jgi:hypothetical protein